MIMNLFFSFSYIKYYCIYYLIVINSNVILALQSQFIHITPIIIISIQLIINSLSNIFIIFLIIFLIQ